MLLLLGRAAEAQTQCAADHSAVGVFICYPGPSEHPTDLIIPDIFHLSAQGNAAAGQGIAGFKVLIDNRLIYENKLPAPLERLSIETNLKLPFDSGSHTLRLVVDGAGSAEVKGLQIYRSKNSGFCDPFSRPDPRVCRTWSNRGSLQWSLTESAPGPSTRETARKPADPLDGYFSYIELYGQNLKSIEADTSDAMAVDAQGNLYVAAHVFTDVELRKYGPNGGLVYASLVRSCGPGFMSVAGLAIDNAGRAWIAGNTTACLPTTPGAVQLHISEAGRTRGFVILMDTTKPAATPPLYVTYLSDVDHRIAAIRADSQGNAYVTGTTASSEFPHESSLRVAEDAARSGGTRLGFVSALNPLGSALLWSTLLPHAELAALALDGSGNVYVTGRVASCRPSSGARKPARPADAPAKPTMGCDDVLVAELSDRGRRLSYAARFGGSADEEGRAISTTAQGGWILVAGDSASTDFPSSPATDSSRQEGSHSFAAALKPCRTGILHSRLLADVDTRIAPEIAQGPALDAFTTAFSGVFAAAGQAKTAPKPVWSVQTAPACSSTTP